MADFWGSLRGALLWLAALVLSVLPRRLWRHLEPPFPILSAVFVSCLIVSSIGFAIDVRGTLNFVFAASASRTAAMLGVGTDQRVAQGLADAGPLMTLASFLYFPFFTHLGQLATYLMVSGAVRALAAWFEDPRGDFVLSAAYGGAAALFRKNQDDRTRLARERREGPDAPDVLRTGDWAGIDVDYVVLAARRKPEWNAGAIVMTSGDWYRLGAPFDMDTPGGVRAVYPLKKLDAVEVVRRGIEYELPAAHKDESLARREPGEASHFLIQNS